MATDESGVEGGNSGIERPQPQALEIYLRWDGKNLQIQSPNGELLKSLGMLAMARRVLLDQALQGGGGGGGGGLITGARGFPGL